MLQCSVHIVHDTSQLGCYGVSWPFQPRVMSLRWILTTGSEVRGRQYLHSCLFVFSFKDIYRVEVIDFIDLETALSGATTMTKTMKKDDDNDDNDDDNDEVAQKPLSLNFLL